MRENSIVYLLCIFLINVREEIVVVFHILYWELLTVNKQTVQNIIISPYPAYIKLLHISVILVFSKQTTQLIQSFHQLCEYSVDWCIES